MKEANKKLVEQLNQQTGRVHWLELQRHFARGVLIKTDQSLDLVDLALKFHEDQKEVIAELMNSGKLHKATDQDAIIWHENNTEFWAVVVAPWVLVQEISE